MITIREFLLQNKGKLYAALPSQVVEGQTKPIAARYIIAENLNLTDTTVYTILTGRLDKTHASEKTMERVVAEAIKLLRSTETIVKEYETFELEQS